MEGFNLDFDEKFLHSLAASISEAVGYDLKQSRAALNTFTDNNTPTLIWDLINTNINKKLGMHGVPINTNKVGLWKFLLLHNAGSNNVVTIMREERLKSILRQKEQHKKHYAAALAATFNKGLKPKVEQTTLFKMEEKTDEQYLTLLSNELCNGFDDMINTTCRYVIFCFSSSNYQLNSLSAYVLTPKLELVHRESLNKYINPSYDIAISKDENNEPKKDINISLTPDALKKKKANESKKDELQSLKETQTEKENEQSNGD